MPPAGTSPHDALISAAHSLRTSRCCAIANVVGNLVLVDVGLQLVRRRHHHQVGPLGGIGHRHHLKAVGLDLLRGRRTGPQGDADLLDAGVLQVQRVRAALRAVADDRDLLALDEIDVGITIVINAHGFLCAFRS